MKKKEAVSIDHEVLGLGFHRGKSYNVPEMPNISLTAYFKPPTVAVVYHHETIGIWLDFAAEDQDNEITVTNGPIGTEADTRLEKQISWLKNYSVSQLHEAMEEKLDVNGDYLSIDESNFHEYFEQSHRKDMKFRARNGGISHAEFSRHVEEIDKKFSDKDLHQAFITTKSQELEQWSEEEQAMLDDDASYFFIIPF